MNKQFSKKPLFALLPMAFLVACAGHQTTETSSAIAERSTPDVVIPVAASTDFVVPEQSQDDHYAQIQDESETDPEENITQEEEDTDFETGMAATETETETTETLNASDDTQLVDSEATPMTTMVIENSDHLVLAAYHAASQDMQADDDHNPLPGDEKFFFGFDKKTLSQDEIDKIADKGKILSQNPQMKVIINGHTDSRGDEVYNRQLSIKRAEFVADILKSAGASDSQIEIHGWGSDKPMVSDTTYQENRRVEVTFESMHYASND